MAETELSFLKLDVEAAVEKLKFQAEVLQLLGPDLCSPGYLQSSIVLEPRFGLIHALLVRLQGGEAALEGREEDPRVNGDFLQLRDEYQRQLEVFLEACQSVASLSEPFVVGGVSLVAFVKGRAPSFVPEAGVVEGRHTKGAHSSDSFLPPSIHKYGSDDAAKVLNPPSSQ